MREMHEILFADDSSAKRAEASDVVDTLDNTCPTEYMKAHCNDWIIKVTQTNQALTQVIGFD